MMYRKPSAKSPKLSTFTDKGEKYSMGSQQVSKTRSDRAPFYYTIKPTNLELQFIRKITSCLCTIYQQTSSKQPIMDLGSSNVQKFSRLIQLSNRQIRSSIQLSTIQNGKISIDSILESFTIM